MKYIVKLQINPPQFSLNNIKELPLDTTESSMARPQDTPSLTIPTDLDIAGSGIVFREVRKTWMKAARADIRLELQKGLKARNLGLPDVENFALNQAKQRHSTKYKDKRISFQIQSDMSVKLRDAYQSSERDNTAKV